MNYPHEDAEKEFVVRTLRLLEQYDSLELAEKERLEITLLVNALLGLVIVPKEKLLTYLPNERIEEASKFGLFSHQIRGDKVKTVSDLMIALRHSAAHFDVAFDGDENDKIQTVVFSDNERGIGEIARFAAAELPGIVRNVAAALVANYEKQKKES